MSFREDDFDIESASAAVSSGRSAMILQPEIRAVVYKPSWFGKETIFRPYPAVDPRDGSFLPYRLDPGGQARISPFIKMYDAAWEIGEGRDKLTFLVNDRYTSDRTFRPEHTPLGVFFSYARQNADTEGRQNMGITLDCVRLIGTKTSQGLLKPVSQLYALQGMLLVHNDVVLTDKGAPPGAGDQPPCILTLSGGTGRDLMSLFGRQNPDFQGDPADFEGRYLYGDPVSLDTGRFIRLVQAEANRSGGAAAASSSMAGWRQRAGQQQQLAQQGGGGFVKKGYQVDLLQKLGDDFWPVLNSPEEMEDIRAHWLDWTARVPDGTPHGKNKVFWVPSYPEQARLLAKVYPSFIHVLIEAFRVGHSDWIDSDMKAAAVARTQVGFDGVNPTRDERRSSEQLDDVPQSRPSMGGWRGRSQGAVPATPSTPALPATPRSPAQPATQPVSRHWSADEMLDAIVDDAGVSDLEDATPPPVRRLSGRPDPLVVDADEDIIISSPPARSRKPATPATPASQPADEQLSPHHQAAVERLSARKKK